MSELAGATRIDESGASADGFRVRGLEAYVSGDLAGAHTHFLEAVRIDPLNADAMCDLAAAELERGEFVQAAHWVDRALVPEHDAGRFTCAMAHQGCGRLDAAIAKLEALLADQAFVQRNPELAGAARQRLIEWRSADSAGASRFRIVDPAQASFKHRFDILAKYLYALRYLGLQPDWVNVDIATMYRKHIHLRTGGIEPGSELSKSSVDDYVRDFESLIAGMADRGFDPMHPVPVSNENGLPRNGAHRIAAALAARCHVAVQVEDGPGWSWDDEWFRLLGFSTEERNVLLRAWASIKKQDASVVLLWSPVKSAWAEIEAAIDAAMPVVSRRTLEFSHASLAEFVHDVYAYDWGPKTGENIERKIGLLRAHDASVRVLFVERPSGADDDLARRTKLAVRERFCGLCPVDQFTTLHVSESEAEMLHLLDIVASENNLRWLAHRVAPRRAMIERLAELHASLVTRGVAPSQCCVVGGSVLDALGLRAADDVDFTLRGELREAHFDQGVTRLSENLDVVARGYSRSFGGDTPPDDDALIANPSNHFVVRGLRFADPRIVLTRKQHQRRDKDLRDVPLLAGLLERIAIG
ncbi:MAG: hypothetical protein KJZ83_16830 [Burkholderiaceae bacterium]|nr:hypothetical protein [Burkholderiaceae bacterium]